GGGGGWGRERCGRPTGGRWIAGAMKNASPSARYRGAQLPAGPAGKGTLQYDGGWGLAAASKNKAEAMDLISFLTSQSVELGNAKAFGVMPSVISARKKWLKLYPQWANFLAGATYSESIPPVPDIATVLGDFNQQLQNLPQTSPNAILGRVNTELQQILK